MLVEVTVSEELSQMQKLHSACAAEIWFGDKQVFNLKLFL